MVATRSRGMRFNKHLLKAWFWGIFVCGSPDDGKGQSSEPSLRCLGFQLLDFCLLLKVYMYIPWMDDHVPPGSQPPFYRTERDAGSVGFLHLLFFHVFSLFHFHLSICPKSQGKPKRNTKNNPVRRIWSKSIPDCFFFAFLVFLVFLEVFAVPSPTVQKLKENQKNQKKTKKPILWEESWVSPFRIGFFGLFGFSRGFCCPKPTCPKTRGKPKKTKKTILWEESWVSPFRIVFLFFWFIWFFSRFLLSQAQLSKNWRQQNYLCGKEKNIYIYIYVCIRFSLRNRLSNYLLKLGLGKN